MYDNNSIENYWEQAVFIIKQDFIILKKTEKLQEISKLCLKMVLYYSQLKKEYFNNCWDVILKVICMIFQKEIEMKNSYRFMKKAFILFKNFSEDQLFFHHNIWPRFLDYLSIISNNFDKMDRGILDSSITAILCFINYLVKKFLKILMSPTKKNNLENFTQYKKSIYTIVSKSIKFLKFQVEEDKDDGEGLEYYEYKKKSNKNNKKYIHLDNDEDVPEFLDDSKISVLFSLRLRLSKCAHFVSNENIDFSKYQIKFLIDCVLLCFEFFKEKWIERLTRPNFDQNNENVENEKLLLFSFFSCFDNYFKAITRFSSPNSLNNDYDKKLLNHIKSWVGLFTLVKLPNSDKIKVIERILYQIAMLIFQLMRSYSLNDLNMSTLDFVNKMVTLSIKLILMQKKKSTKKSLTKIIRNSFDEILIRYCESSPLKLKNPTDEVISSFLSEIAEMIIEFLKSIDNKQKKIGLIFMKNKKI